MLALEIISNIYYGLSQWSRSDALTFWNPMGGARTIDYLMGSLSLLFETAYFTLSSTPIVLATDQQIITRGQEM